MTQRLSASQKVLHTKALALSRRHRRVESRLVEMLREIDSSGLFKSLGHSSLFVYAVKELRFSESTAYAFNAVARKTREVTALQTALKEEKFSVARASRIVSVLTTENAASLIDFAARHTAVETDREVARLAGKPPGARQRTLKVSDDSLDLLKRAQSLLASRKKKHLSPDEALKLVLEDYLERHDPVRKAERAVYRQAKKDAQNSERSEPTNTAVHMPLPSAQNSQRSEQKQATAHARAQDSALPRPQTFERAESAHRRRKPLTASEKHAVFRRDGGRCTFVNVSGERCARDRWLHVHHIRQVSVGGGNELSNLTSLCSFHHDLVHQLSFPLEGQVNWIKAPVRGYCC